MTKQLLALACLTVFAVAACKPEPAGPVAATPATGLNAPDLSSAAYGFDMKAFAGTFTGTLPCASCPGIDTTLVLNADGTYAITEVHQDENDSATEMDGTWTAEADDRQLRLDPNSKAEQDRLFAINSDERITPLDLQAQPVESGLGYGLGRQPAH